MLNTHFLYLLGHLRLLEEQHSVTSLNRSGIGLIGTTPYNQLYIDAIKCCAHHSELKSICQLSPSLPSMTDFMCQKRKIEELINHDDVDCIIMTSTCSDELLKFAIHTAVIAGKDILLNDIPNYNEIKLKEVLEEAARHGVFIGYNQPFSFDNQFSQIKTALMSKHGLETGLLRLTTHRICEAENQLPFNILRNTITKNIELLLSLMPDVLLSNPAIQYSHPFMKRADGDVLMINFRQNGGLLISFEIFFNTGKISDKLSLKQCNNRYEVAKKISFNEKNQEINQNNFIVEQLDQFILKLASNTKLAKINQWSRANKLTDKVIKQLNTYGYI
ncbi:hypothetical protein [Providencia sp. PROV032]|uniref:hypothetical protein n=1 Tax=Providencia sp. PROV032 TaxID=2949764 RepID=UPI002349E958|nr:hypothetical protein [Providencia sp. PROV032]